MAERGETSKKKQLKHTPRKITKTEKRVQDARISSDHRKEDIQEQAAKSAPCRKMKRNALNIITRADIILFVVLILAALSGILLPFISNGAAAGQVEIRLNGQLYGTYSLKVDRTIRIENQGNENVIVISDGRVHMDFSSCRNQTCVKQGTVSRPGEIIVCLPNRVTAEITGKKEEGDVDAVSE